MEDTRCNQGVKSLLAHLNQQVLQVRIHIPASDSQLVTEQLCKRKEQVYRNNAQTANNSSHKHAGTNV